MSDTPRTDAANTYIRTRRDFTITDHQVWQEHGEHLECELNEANKRIKRLVQAGDCLLSHSKSTDYHEKIIEWYKAKKDKQ